MAISTYARSLRMALSHHTLSNYGHLFLQDPTLRWLLQHKPDIFRYSGYAGHNDVDLLWS